MSLRIGIDKAKIEAEKFVNYYTSNGWKVGKNPMKSWTHAVNNWITNAKQYAKGTTKDKPKLREETYEFLNKKFALNDSLTKLKNMNTSGMKQEVLVLKVKFISC